MNKKYINKNILEEGMPKGRPVRSQIRQNIIEILYFFKKLYGYEIYKMYIQLYPKVTMRSIYYNLAKGVQLGEIKIDKIQSEKGEYSWGDEAEKIYYAIGQNAKPQIDKRVKEFFDKKQQK